MLNEELLEALSERLVNRLEQLNETVLTEIGKSVKLIGTLSPTRAFQVAQTIKYGGSLNKIVEAISKTTQLNVKDIYEIFEAVAKKNQDFAKIFYEVRGIDFIPYEQNIALQRQVRALASVTATDYINFSRTMAYSTKDALGNTIYTDLSKTYQDMVDKSVLAVSQGKQTFQQSMKSTIDELGSSGLKTVDYASGRSVRLDSAVRQNLLGGLRDMSNTIQRQFGQEFGADGVEISVHLHPAEDHEDVQGHQFSNFEFDKFQNGFQAVDSNGKVFEATKDGKDRRAISTLNCQHYIFSILLGISKPQYSQTKLNEINIDNNKGVEIDGKHYTAYEATQLQRKLEVKIRENKDLQILGRASGNKDVVSSSQKNITLLTNKYRQVSKIANLPTKMQRLRVTGYKRVAIKNV